MKNWNRVNGECHNLPGILYEASSRVVQRYIEQERESYERASKSECVDHVYLELHCLDFWLRSQRQGQNRSFGDDDYPMHLQTVGSVTVSQRAARIVAKDSLERILDAHRLYPWGMTFDASAGETRRFEFEALTDHQGELTSYHWIPGRTCHHEVEVKTTLRTDTQVTVKATPLAGTYDYDTPGHRIERNKPDDS